MLKNIFRLIFFLELEKENSFDFRNVWAFIVYGPLLNGCTSILYEGKPVGTPDAGAYWRMVEEYNVKM